MKNEIFFDQDELVDKLINFIQPKLFKPEDMVVEYGMSDKNIYFIAHGRCLVQISNHLRKKDSIHEIEEGECFGEIAVLFDSNRTADVQCITHATLGTISKVDFQKFLNFSPEMYTSFKQRALQYCDPWISFKIMLLKQIDYF